jgi:dTDP-4-amino-4,6-dideoxygalactose transaminase
MKPSDHISFLDLITPHAELKQELCEVFSAALATAGFVGGPMVEDFERDFAEYCETRHCIGVSSGTDALRFALIAAGIGRGEVVVTAPNTFIATAEAISQAGGTPEFVDVDEATLNMDAGKLMEYVKCGCVFDRGSGILTSRKFGRPVRAIIPVHLYGQMAEMDPILELAANYNLTVIEDACQAHGAKYFSRKEQQWKKAGSMGRAAAFSFYPGKNLGACGEGGAVVTNDDSLANQIRMLRDHGQVRKYYHDIEGYNGRLHSIQAGVLRIKLKHLDAWNAQRRECARRYAELLGSVEGYIRLPYEPKWSQAVYHLYVIRAPERDRIQQQLASANIGTGIHYPIPLHLQKAYRFLGYGEGDFPVAEAAARDGLSLPMYAGLSAEQQCAVAIEVSRALPAGARVSVAGA